MPDPQDQSMFRRRDSPPITSYGSRHWRCCKKQSPAAACLSRDTIGGKPAVLNNLQIQVHAACRMSELPFIPKRTQEGFQPVGIHGVDMRAGDDDKFTRRLTDTKVE